VQIPVFTGLTLGLFPRLLVLAILFAAELLLITVWLDDGALTSRAGLLGLVGVWGAWSVRGIVGFAAIFMTFAYLKSRTGLNDISAQVNRIPVGRGLMAAHVLAMAAFGWLAWALYGNHFGAQSTAWATPLWLAAAGLGIVSAAFALVPPALWMRLIRDTGWLWAYTLVAVIAACVVGAYSRSLWAPSAQLTFSMVKGLLGLFIPGVVANPATSILGTTKFSVEIAPECSGLEGVGLMLAFGSIWLWLFRKECRFPQALILIPAGAAIIFLLNTVRLTALILIGNAGAPGIALGGFHSQAGWIAFNAVALGFSLVARRVPWLTHTEVTRIEPAGIASTSQPPRTTAAENVSGNPAATYLLPFLSILAIGMVSAAASGGFEWLYPLRFFAAAGALWFLRKRYASVDWRFSWFGPTIGAVVFILWIALDAFLRAPAHDAMPQALAGAVAPLRATWLTFRVFAAVVTVPIAEELAFRGFLIRRFMAADFEALPSRAFTWAGLGITSLVFGLLHGNLWFAGIVAGLFYAWAMLRRGRIGEAVVAHATTNALLAAYVLFFHKWHLW
jgi:exosortase E/protease (VPEID-CTERM system)